MHEQRRHQRIRFGVAPAVRIGFGGAICDGTIENLSPQGLMARCDLPLEIGRSIGCEFRIFGSQLVDLPATVVSRIGDMFGVRFLGGPLSQVLVDDAIKGALASGKGAVLSVHDTGGKKVMRIVGGLCGSLRSDFMHALTRVGIDEIDLSAVSTVEPAGIALCLVATSRYGVTLGAMSPCVVDAWKQALAAPGTLPNAEDWATDTNISAVV